MKHEPSERDRKDQEDQAANTAGLEDRFSHALTLTSLET